MFTGRRAGAPPAVPRGASQPPPPLHGPSTTDPIPLAGNIVIGSGWHRASRMPVSCSCVGQLQLRRGRGSSRQLNLVTAAAAAPRCAMIMHYGRTLSDAEAVQLENWMSATLNVPLLPRRPPAAAFRGPARAAGAVVQPQCLHAAALVAGRPHEAPPALFAAWPATCYTPVPSENSNLTAAARLDENGLVECMSTSGTACDFDSPSACATMLATPLSFSLIPFKCTQAAMQTYPGWCYSAAVHLGVAVGTQPVFHRAGLSHTSSAAAARLWRAQKRRRPAARLPGFQSCC